MIRLCLILKLSLMFSALQVTGLNAQSSLEVITYQGQLVEGNKPVVGSKIITFGLYRSLTTNSADWQETRSVNVEQGIFSVQLQVPAAVVNANDSLYLRIQVDEIDQRIRFGSVAYAMRAARADEVKAGSVGTAQLATGAVTSSTIADGEVSSEDLASGAVRSSKIATGQVVKSLNNLRDDIQIVGGDGIAIGVQSNTLTISSDFVEGGVQQISGADGLQVTNPNGPVATIGLQNNGINAGKILPNVVSSIDGVSNDGGDINLVAGANVTITPDDVNNRITIAASGGTGVQSVSQGNAITVSNPTGPNVTVGVTNNAINDAEIQDNSLTQLSLAANSVGNSEIQNNAVDVSKISTNLVSSVDGVFNDGGNIDLVAGPNVSITPDNVNNRITISAAGGTGGAGVQSINGGNAITVSDPAGPTATVAVTNNAINDAEIQDNSLTQLSLAPNSVGSSELQNNAVSADKISTSIVSSIDGVFNDGGNIDLVPGANVSITPDNVNNRITISAVGGGGGGSGVIASHNADFSGQTIDLPWDASGQTFFEMRDIVSTTITAPGTGIFIVSATAQARFEGDGLMNVITYQIDDTQGGNFIPGEFHNVGYDRASPNGKSWLSVSIQKIFPAQAGQTKTFRLEAANGNQPARSNGNHTTAFWSPVITAVYVPF